MEELQRLFALRYPDRVKRSNDFTFMIPLMGLMKELASYGLKALPYMRIVEQDLFERGLVEFIVKSPSDLSKVIASNSKGKRCQYYICEVLRLKEVQW